MELKVIRKWQVGKATQGELYINGEKHCFTEEDALRPAGVKIPGETCIPAGKYEVKITMSNRFKRLLPLLVDVPGFEGIRIHTGNTAADTHGCILVGQIRISDSIGNSRAAFAPLFEKMGSAILEGEKVYIEIVDADNLVPVA